MGARYQEVLQLLSGCALATKGLHQSVSIASSPAGATVLVDGREAGVTPLVARLPRSAVPVFLGA